MRPSLIETGAVRNPWAEVGRNSAAAGSRPAWCATLTDKREVGGRRHGERSRSRPRTCQSRQGPAGSLSPPERQTHRQQDVHDCAHTDGHRESQTHTHTLTRDQGSCNFARVVRPEMHMHERTNTAVPRQPGVLLYHQSRKRPRACACSAVSPCCPLLECMRFEWGRVLGHGSCCRSASARQG